MMLSNFKVASAMSPGVVANPVKLWVAGDRPGCRMTGYIPVNENEASGTLAAELNNIAS